MIRWRKWKDGLLLVLAIGIVFFVAFCTEHAPRKHLQTIEPAVSMRLTPVAAVGPQLVASTNSRAGKRWGPTFPVYGSPVCLSVAGYPVATEKCHVQHRIFKNKKKRHFTRLYRAWLNMRYRCHTPGAHDYKDYGGRGIRICKRWSSFAHFAQDMHPHPGRGWMLDRKKNHGHYCKSNCRWATPKVQARNRRSTKLTEGQVREIRKSYVPRKNSAALMKRFNISQEHLSKIHLKKIWKAHAEHHSHQQSSAKGKTKAFHSHFS